HMILPQMLAITPAMVVEKVVEEVVEKVGFKERDKSVRDEVKRRGHCRMAVPRLFGQEEGTVKERRYFEDREIKLREDIYEQKVRDEKEEEVVKPSRRRVMEMDENRRASTVRCCQVHCTSSKPASCSRVCCFGAAYHYMLEQPTDDSVQIAVDFDKECGCILQHLCLKGLHGIFERFRGILHKGEIDKRFSFRLRAYLPSEKLISGFMEIPLFSMKWILWRDDEINPEPSLDIFRQDPNFVENEKKYEELKKSTLGERSQRTGMRKMQMLALMKMELCIVLLECCSQERSHVRFYVLLGTILSYLEHLGIRSLNEWHNNPLMSDLYESNFRKDNPSNACHDGLPSTSSTSMIGSGGLAKNLRDDRYNMPQMIMQQQKAKQEDGSDGSGSISSGTLCCV
ncbi:hypothetical protein KSS87_007767, partial [Heliosperma pusillum]